MTHDEALHLLSARIDGPLPADQDQALDAWLAECSDNRVLAEAFQSQHGELRTAFEPRRDAARETAAAVSRQLTEPPSAAPEPAPATWRRYLAAPIPAACAAALLIAAGVYFFRSGTTTSPSHSPVVIHPADHSAEFGLTSRPKPEAPKPTLLAVGEKMETKAGQKHRVTLPDGSIVYLNQNTQIALASNRHVVLSKGEVFVEAVPARSDDDRFLVEGPNRSVTAHGTKFAVTANKTGTGVLVTQGKVAVTGLNEKVTTGQELLPGADKVAPAPRASAALDWTRDLMVAAESPLVPAGKYSGGSLVAVDPYGQEAKLQLVKYHIDVHIEDGFARTTIDQTYFNSENSRMEGTFYFPLPPDASLSRLAMYVDGDLMEGGMAEREHARDVYERIRYQNRDPALLEWVDGSVFKMRVFPLEARQEKRIVLSYSQKLPVLYGHSTYRFPAGHTLAVVDQWSFRAFVKDGARMSAASSSHPNMQFTQQGQDLVAADEARPAKVDRDVVLELQDHQVQANADTFRWSAGELDGQKYLMVRYRPDLPSAPRRERRDWVFLFESSGARDPLVARAQVEVIRALLTHAEHEDTFAVLSVGTRVRKWSETPEPATPENIDKAVAWLEKRHLIGALNLDQALSDAATMLRAGSNPHLVHVGGGIASIGEQRADELVKRIPEGTRYVGIGVGKRFSPAFMKVAAERTGGLFTQVNPDEPINWRGFEIASTLNAPRLLNVRLETPGLNGVRFLTFSNTLAHGEELAAVANVTHAMPKSVTIRGTMDGQVYERVVPVENVAAGAGYLPRTWAKLEIDRMLAENSQANQRAITDLSKAMYVMTPFTSLLVLENEQMYKDFKVDRGRKDHWAMYPCPPKIPVVYIPDPNQPAGTRPDLKGQKPHANVVLQTVLVRNPPRFLTWPGQGGGDNPIETAGQRWGGAIAVPMESDELAIEFEEVRDGVSDTLMLGDRVMDRLAADVDKLGRAMGQSSFRRSHVMFDPQLKEAGEAVKDLTREKFRLKEDLALDFAEMKDRKRLALLARQPERWRPAIRGFFESSSLDLAPTDEAAARMLNEPARLDYFMKFNEYGLGVIRSAPLDGKLREGAEFYNQMATGVRWNDLDGERFVDDLQKKFKGRLPPRRRAFAVGQDEAGIPHRGERLLKLRVEDLKKQLREVDARTEEAQDKNKDGAWKKINDAEVAASYFASVVREPQYYGRPSFNGNSRVFTDLVAYAPGMSSSVADVRAVLEAEAAPRFGNRRGSIDPAARKLIDRARTGEWKALHLPAGDGKTIAFVHDGAGRYAYERPVAFGLMERVVCDGTHLWHMYPELGIGAERVVSRFHRAPLLDLVPDLVPPADDLAFGADVKLVDDKTVALVPLGPAQTEDDADAWLEIHMVFDGARLAERQWVLQPKREKRELLAHEVYEGSTTRLINFEAKELDSSKQDVRPAQAPNLKPDLSQLVVLPLPLRSREHVYRQFEMEPGWNLHHDRNACFEYLPDADAMKLLACEFAANNGGNVADVWYTCFGKKGDHRTGFFTLMAAAGQGPRSYWAFNQRFENDATDPLVRYLWQLYDPNLHDWQARFGFGPGYPKADTFLGRLTAFRQIFDRWNGGLIGDQFWGQRDGERERALEFAVHNADNVLGWCALGMLQDRCTSAATYKAVADVWGVLAEKSGLKYPARYEQARCLGNSSDHYAVAQQKYQALFHDALKEGVLPPLDSSFRSVLDNGEQGTWAKLMRETAAKCAEKKARPVIVTLAWQCYQLGDTAMSDTLLDQAVKDVPGEEKLFTHVAAIHFLTATGRHDRADQLIRDLLVDQKLAKAASLWRLGVRTADNRHDPVRAAECLERALDVEYARRPDMYDVQPIRNDYGRLLSHYEWLADASASLKVRPPKDLVARVVKAADRWRELDPEAQDVCNRVATILRKAGGDGTAELAWDYVTTPLAVKPNEAGPWTSLAASLRQEGNWRLADKCYAMAFAAEPTNAQLLWDRAQHLQNQGQIAESRALLKQLAESEWQPRFNGLKAQARQAIEGR